MKSVVLLAGDYGTGKTFLSNELAKVVNDSVAESLSYSLRLELAELLFPIGISKEDLFAKPTPDYIRKFMHGLGQYRKLSDEHYWIKSLLCRSIEFKHIFIDDCRFINEIDYFRSRSQFYQTTVIYLGDKSNSYELVNIANNADLFFEAKPSVEMVLSKLKPRLVQ
jgi:ribonuclease BN (tRNA processing enzyme)